MMLNQIKFKAMETIIYHKSILKENFEKMFPVYAGRTRKKLTVRKIERLENAGIAVGLRATSQYYTEYYCRTDEDAKKVEKILGLKW